jgi:hypothetical protein
MHCYFKKNLDKLQSAVLAGKEAICAFFAVIFAKFMIRGIKEVKKYKNKIPCNYTVKTFFIAFENP